MFFKLIIIIITYETKTICTNLNLIHIYNIYCFFFYLQKFGFLKADIIKKIQILTFHPITITNYVMLLEEGGFHKSKVDPNVVLRYFVDMF